jgi:hypothetical protein
MLVSLCVMLLSGASASSALSVDLPLAGAAVTGGAVAAHDHLPRGPFGDGI